MGNDNAAPDQKVSDLQIEMGKIDWTKEDDGEWFLITSYFDRSFTNPYLRIISALLQLPERKGTVQQIAEMIPKILGPDLGLSISYGGDFSLSYEQKMQATCAVLQPWPIKPLYRELLRLSIKYTKHGSEGRFAIVRESGEGKDSIWQITENQEEQT